MSVLSGTPVWSVNGSWLMCPGKLWFPWCLFETWIPETPACVMVSVRSCANWWDNSIWLKGKSSARLVLAILLAMVPLDTSRLDSRCIWFFVSWAAPRGTIEFFGLRAGSRPAHSRARYTSGLFHGSRRTNTCETPHELGSVRMCCGYPTSACSRPALSRLTLPPSWSSCIAPSDSTASSSESGGFWSSPSPRTSWTGSGDQTGLGLFKYTTGQ